MKRIIIVGGGIAGLTAGIYAQKYGFESVIYEKHTIVGGQCTGWDRKGYHIDNCIHWLTGSSEKSEMYESWVETGALGPDVELIKIPYFGVYEIDGVTITLWKDSEKLRKELKDISPADAALIDELVDNIIAGGSVEMPIKAPMDMLPMKDLMELGSKSKPAMQIMKKYQHVSCVEYGKKYQHPALQKLFAVSMPDGYSITAFIMSMATVCSGDGDIPKGGSRAMAFRIADKYQKMGGQIITGTGVDEIMTEKVNGKETAVGVRLESGEIMKADYVVAAGDAYYTLHKLLKGRFADKQLDSRFADRKVYKLPTSAHVIFAVDAEAKDIPKSIFFPTEPYTVATKTFTDMSFINYAYEPDFHPEGKSLFSVYLDQSDDDFLWWEKLYQNQDDYQNEKMRLASLCQERIEKRYPELKGKLTLIDTYTPMTYQRFTGTYHGAWMSFLMTPQSKSLQHKGIIKGLKNCYMAGMYMLSPGGLPVALATGKFAILRICKQEKIKL